MLDILWAPDVQNSLATLSQTHGSPTQNHMSLPRSRDGGGMPWFSSKMPKLNMLSKYFSNIPSFLNNLLKSYHPQVDLNSSWKTKFITDSRSGPRELAGLESELFSELQDEQARHRALKGFLQGQGNTVHNNGVNLESFLEITFDLI